MSIFGSRLFLFQVTFIHEIEFAHQLQTVGVQIPGLDKCAVLKFLEALEVVRGTDLDRIDFIFRVQVFLQTFMGRARYRFTGG